MNMLIRIVHGNQHINRRYVFDKPFRSGQNSILIDFRNDYNVFLCLNCLLVSMYVHLFSDDPELKKFLAMNLKDKIALSSSIQVRELMTALVETLDIYRTFSRYQKYILLLVCAIWLLSLGNNVLVSAYVGLISKYFRLFKSNKPYIKEKQKDLVRAHGYQGACYSYTYKLFYSPICDYLVSKSPRWLAPNAISMIGFMFNIIPHIAIVIMFSGDLEGYIPPWFCYLLGFSFFAYNVCDNSDGKQARRTRTSSPLGMLLDHGMDSVTAVINNFLLQRLMQVGNSQMNMIALLVSTMPFYSAMLEQYYTGELILQVVNGVDDGSILYILLCILAGVYGCDVWKEKYSVLGYPPTQLSHIFVYVLLASLTLFTLDNIKNIFLKRSCKQFQIVFAWPYFISHIAWYIITATLFLSASYFTQEDIMAHYPRRVMYAFGFQFIQMTLRIQLSGVTHEKFNPFRRSSIITWAVLIAHLVHVFLFGKSFMDEATMYLFLDVLCFASLLHFVVNVTQELQSILNINLLTMTKAQLAAQPALEEEARKSIKQVKGH